MSLKITKYLFNHAQNHTGYSGYLHEKDMSLGLALDSTPWDGL